MVLDELLQLLKSDAELQLLLNATPQDPKIYPLATHKIQDCIVYNLATLMSDHVIEQHRLSMTVISKGLIKALTISSKVKNILLTLGDEPKTEHILEITLNGGSEPIENIDTGTIHIKANFIIKTRGYE